VKVAMAKHMDHSVGTADKYYDVSTGAKLTASFRSVFEKFHDPTSEGSANENDYCAQNDVDVPTSRLPD
jgi:hypothetical protein